jgi:hypothetical protein
MIGSSLARHTISFSLSSFSSSPTSSLPNARDRRDRLRDLDAISQLLQAGAATRTRTRPGPGAGRSQRAALSRTGKLPTSNATAPPARGLSRFCLFHRRRLSATGNSLVSTMLLAKGPVPSDYDGITNARRLEHAVSLTFLPQCLLYSLFSLPESSTSTGTGTGTSAGHCPPNNVLIARAAPPFLLQHSFYRNTPNQSDVPLQE